MSAGTFQTMAPSAQRSALVTVVVLALAVFAHLFAVLPFKASLARVRSELETTEMQLRAATRDLRSQNAVRDGITKVGAARQVFLDALLEPLLESHAMRAKLVVEPVALEMGLRGLDYAELPIRLLPLPAAVPGQLYARFPIRVTCRGSYMAIASFVMRMERDFPLVSLEAFTIETQPNPDEQKADLVFEWPTKGPVTTAAARKGPVAAK